LNAARLAGQLFIDQALDGAEDELAGGAAPADGGLVQLWWSAAGISSEVRMKSGFMALSRYGSDLRKTTLLLSAIESHKTRVDGENKEIRNWLCPRTAHLPWNRKEMPAESVWLDRLPSLGR
jgi:hypothetical protein